jgi:hypothetical protein
MAEKRMDGEPLVNATAETTAPKPTANGRKATQFQPGNPGPRGLKRKGQGRGRRKPPQLLRDLRFVYSHAEGQDKSQGQRLCRKLLTNDPKAFLSQMAHLEKAHLQGAGKATESKAVPEVDEGEERAFGLIEEFFEQHQRGLAEADAKLAARPDAAQLGATLQKRLAETLDREKQLRERIAEFERKEAAKAIAQPAASHPPVESRDRTCG